MKAQNKILIYSIIAALVFWVLDAFMASLTHDNASFIDMVFHADELNSRLFFSAFLLMFGLIIAKILASEDRYDMDLKEREEKYRSIVESSVDSIYLVDKDYKYIFMNKKHMYRMGLSGNGYIGQPYSAFHSPQETDIFIKSVNKVFETSIPVRHEHRSRRDGKYFLRTLSPVKNQEGAITVVTVVSKEVTDLKLMEEKLHALSITDELTGIYNRRGFFTLIQQQYKMARRINRGFHILYADLDGLKKINDQFGHHEGDAALIEAANILKESFRESDIIARIGGDEFVVAPIETTESTIDTVTARFRDHLAIYNGKRNRKYTLSISTGVTYYDPQEPCSTEELLSKADKLMYEHKKLKLEF